MRKNIKFLIAVLMSAVLFTSCFDKDEKETTVTEKSNVQEETMLSSITTSDEDENSDTDEQELQQSSVLTEKNAKQNDDDNKTTIEETTITSDITSEKAKTTKAKATTKKVTTTTAPTTIKKETTTTVPATTTEKVTTTTVPVTTTERETTTTVPVTTTEKVTTTTAPVITTEKVTTTTVPVTTTEKITTTTQAPNEQSDYASEVIRLVNVIRAENGLSQFSTTSSLSSAANARAIELNESFSHTRPDGSKCFTVLGEYGITYSAAGENIALGYMTPKDVVNGWMNSPGHKANILNSSYTQIGVGYDATSNAWTQLFIG